MAQAMAAGAEPGPGAATVGDSIAAHSGQNAPTENSACNVGPHWSRHLKCLVCFGYMQQPHTLACGHTFCRICLVRLGQVARDAHPDIALRRFRLRCPTCRTLFPASTILRGHASTSFLIQNLISDWKKERKRMKTSSTVSLRSICTQTPNLTRRLRRRRKSLNIADHDMHEQFHVRLRLDDYYFRSMTANSSDSSEDVDAANKPQQPIIEPYPPEPSANASETSTASTASSRSGYVFGHRFYDLGHHHVGLGPPRRRFDWAPGRVFLMSMWCMYSMVVVGIAQPMLPYMVFITLFFLLIILK